MNTKKIMAAILVSALILTGCNKVPDETSSTNTINTSSIESSEVTQTEATTEETAETTQEPFEFNPHPYSSILAQEIPQDYWDSFYNMVDAFRVGADTFECSSEEAYQWCMKLSTLANLAPAACKKITGESNDGSVPYENGVGHIYYTIPVDEFLSRESIFERDIVNVINGYVEKDDTDFEKCLKLYDYMECYYDYDHDVNLDVPTSDGYVYAAFMNHTGVCIDFAALYIYLLRQVGVEANPVGCDSPVNHEWVYVTINGQGYHIDPTWLLKSTRGSDLLFLDYFMMSSNARQENGCNVDNLTMQMLPGYWIKYTSIELPATDDRYYLDQYSYFISLDEDNKILYYGNADGETCTLNYGEL